MFLHLSRKDREQPLGTKSPGVFVNALTILARYVPRRIGVVSYSRRGLLFLYHTICTKPAFCTIDIPNTLLSAGMPTVGLAAAPALRTVAELIKNTNRGDRSSKLAFRQILGPTRTNHDAIISSSLTTKSVSSKYILRSTTPKPTGLTASLFKLLRLRHPRVSHRQLVCTARTLRPQELGYRCI